MIAVEDTADPAPETPEVVTTDESTVETADVTPETPAERVWAGKYNSPEELETGYTNLQQLVGKKFNELDDAGKATIADVVRNDLAAALETEIKTALEGDSEWLTARLQDFLTKQVPEQYELKARDGVEFVAEDPLVAATLEVAKANGWSQSQFDGLLDMWAAHQTAAATQHAERIAGEAAKVENYKAREAALVKNVTALTGSQALLMEVTNAESFVALERLVAAAQERTLPPPEVVTTSNRKTKQEIMALRYDADFGSNKAKQQEYNSWFANEYPGEFKPMGR